jgi:predicted membrane channel-forming protein YqfA (hemolysin III family)
MDEKKIDDYIKSEKKSFFIGPVLKVLIIMLGIVVLLVGGCFYALSKI